MRNKLTTLDIEKIDKYLKRKNLIYNLYPVTKQNGINCITAMINAPTPTGFLKIEAYSFEDFKRRFRTAKKEVKEGRYN